MGSVHQICLRWNNHLSNFPKVFEELRKSKDLVDVTLCCEGRKIKAHKLVLSACSQYFQGLFSEIPCKHPVIFFRDVTFFELEAIVNYMYKGEVSVHRDNLDTFLKTAESLQVKGLVMEPGSEESAPAMKETVPVATKPAPRPSVSVSEKQTGGPLSKHKESSWSQNYTTPSKASTPAHRDLLPSSQTTFSPAQSHQSQSLSQATFTPSTVHQSQAPQSGNQTTFSASSIHRPHTPQTTFSPVSHQPPTPQSLGAGSSLQSQPEDEEDDDDVIIEPEIKCEEMDQSASDNASASMTDNVCAKSGDMDSDMYITGDDHSDSFAHGDPLSDEIESIMSNLGGQGDPGSMNMGFGPSTSEGQGEDSPMRRYEFPMFPMLSTTRSNRSKRLTLEEKWRVISEFETQKKSQRQVAREFGLDHKTVGYLLHNKQKIQAAMMKNNYISGGELI